MIQRNIKRENEIYQLWNQGYIVDEISSQMGIPRSTVGYYVRKFNKGQKPLSQLTLINQESKEDTKLERVVISSAWLIFSKHWTALIKGMKYEEAKASTDALLSFIHLYKEILPYIKSETTMTITNTLIAQALSII